jgi:D-tyrosyl-tRNA(Tyr) deacylase
VQRVASASVHVDGELVGEIGRGLLVLVGVTHTDTGSSSLRLAAKLAGLRIFPDDGGAMNRSVADVGGEVLVVSQFTLYGDAAKGRRPSFVAAAPGPVAEPLVDAVIEALEELGLRVASGRFGADMSVTLVNDGPVTILLDL